MQKKRRIRSEELDREHNYFYMHFLRRHNIWQGIGGSTIGPQFVVEALALDDPP
ncbi:unnamed protein product [Arabidopsis halleri]